jgi:F-type H+-transporting ATPase subunit c
MRRKMSEEEFMIGVGLGYIGAGLCAGLCVLGAGLGIGKLAASALDGVARQPEAAGSIQTLMIITAAMCEGMGLLALVIAFLAVSTLNKGIPAAGSSSPASVQASH